MVQLRKTYDWQLHEHFYNFFVVRTELFFIQIQSREKTSLSLKQFKEVK